MSVGGLWCECEWRCEWHCKGECVCVCVNVSVSVSEDFSWLGLAGWVAARPSLLPPTCLTHLHARHELGPEHLPHLLLSAVAGQDLAAGWWWW